jgi:hypothetical protein
MFGPPMLLTAKMAMVGVRSKADYFAQQKAEIDRRRKMLPNYPWNNPWVYVGPLPAVFVSNGKWLIECPCANCPMLEPEWDGLALCYDCGAIYEGLALPPDAAEIEAILIKRPKLGQRYWAPGQSLDTLIAINTELGIPE